jgi:MtN3 and saliva related transmembrane protein
LKSVDVIGWVSSLILVLTLGKQVIKQWQTRDSGGVSTWLFIGQLAASVGFATYSYLLENWVFLTTNLLLVVNALLGQWVTLRNRRATDANGTQVLPGV